MLVFADKFHGFLKMDVNSSGESCDLEEDTTGKDLDQLQRQMDRTGFEFVLFQAQMRVVLRAVMRVLKAALLRAGEGSRGEADLADGAAPHR